MSFLGLGDILGGVTDAIGLTNHSAQSGAQNAANKNMAAASNTMQGVANQSNTLNQQGSGEYNNAYAQQQALLGQMQNQQGLYSMTPQQQQQLNGMISTLHQNHQAAINATRAHLMAQGINDPAALDGVLANLHQQFGNNISQLQNNFAQQTYQQNLANVNNLYANYSNLANQGLNMQQMGMSGLGNVANTQLGIANTNQQQANMYNQQNQANIGSALGMGAFILGGGLQSPNYGQAAGGTLTPASGSNYIGNAQLGLNGMFPGLSLGLGGSLG